MKNFFYVIVVLSLLAGLSPSLGLAAPQGMLPAVDLENGQPAKVSYLETQNHRSFFDVEVTLPGSTAKTYAGWCIQNNIRGELRNENAVLYASTSSNLPEDLAAVEWGQINYLLNNKIRGTNRSDNEFIKDVQGAIWMLLGEEDIAPEYTSTYAEQMAEEARKNSGYTPKPGGVLAVIIYSDGMRNKDPKSYQEAIIEWPITGTPTPTQTQSTITPTRTFTPTPTPTGTPPTLTPTFTPTPTDTTPTFTPTPTDTTPNQCVVLQTHTPVAPGTPVPPTPVNIDFRVVPVGESVETAFEGLKIDAVAHQKDADHTVVRIDRVDDYDLAVTGGFVDRDVNKEGGTKQYIFTFDQTISSFSVRMLDFGDENADLNDTDHFVRMAAYADDGMIISRHQLRYYTEPEENLHAPLFDTVDENGNTIKRFMVNGAGDAANAEIGEPGKWTWTVSGSGITKVVLHIHEKGDDPNIGFDSLSYTPDSFNWNWDNAVRVAVNFNEIRPGESVEGMGKVDPNVNIDAVGTAVSVLEETRIPRGMATPTGTRPSFAYVVDITSIAPASSPTRVNNWGIVPTKGGGFTDIQTINTVRGELTAQAQTVVPRLTTQARTATLIAPTLTAQARTATPSPSPTYEFKAAHQYTIDFATPVYMFNLTMLDFGDFNPTQNRDHKVWMDITYANGEKGVQTLEYDTDLDQSCRRNIKRSRMYGCLFERSGNASSAREGEPGKWIWVASIDPAKDPLGQGIKQVVINFDPYGQDVQMGFTDMEYTICQSPAPTRTPTRAP